MSRSSTTVVKWSFSSETLLGWSVTGRAILGDDTRKAQLVHRLLPIRVNNDAMELSDLVKISDHEAGVKLPNTWYLPVLAVSSPNKPGKVRLVLDAAAKSHGKSLNDFLMKGPDLFNPIPNILIRFRERRTGLTSDVTAMFSQVLVKDEDNLPYGFCVEVAVAVEDLMSMNHP